MWYIQKWPFVRLASWKMFQSYSNSHMSCILVSIIKFQNQFTWKNSASSLKNPAIHCTVRQIQKWPFSRVATWKMFQFYSNFHMSCILVSINNFQNQFTWNNPVSNSVKIHLEKPWKMKIIAFLFPHLISKPNLTNWLYLPIQSNIRLMKHR